jgi:hypothetical protein
MASILQPGFVYWDGFKYILTPGTGGIGPQGPAGPAGPNGTSGSAVLVFQPGGTSISNVYTTWAALWAARTVDVKTIETPMTIIIDDSKVNTTISSLSNGHSYSSGSVNVIDASKFQSPGTVGVASGGNIVAINYTGITGNTLTGCTNPNSIGGTFSTGDYVRGTAQIEVVGATYALNKNTALVGYRTATNAFDAIFGTGTNELTSVSVTKQLQAVLPYFSIPDTTVFTDPCWFDNLIIYAVDSAGVGAFQSAAFSTLDMTLLNVQLAQCTGNIIASPGGSIDCYGFTYMNGDTTGFVVTLNGNNSTYIFNINDNFGGVPGWLATHELTGEGTLIVNTAGENAQWIGGNPVGTVTYNGGSLASNWNSATAGQVLTMVDNGRSSGTPQATWQAATGGGVSLQQTGSPVSGGPFTTLNFESGATIISEGGSTAEITISPGNSGRFIQSTILTAAEGTFTTTSQTNTLRIRGVGSGGAGGGSSGGVPASGGEIAAAMGGGSAADYVEATGAVSPSTGYAYTCGPSALGTSGGTGADGTASTFVLGGRGTITASGGGGAIGGTPVTYAAFYFGGTTVSTSNGDVNVYGMVGGVGHNAIGLGGSLTYLSGYGGSCPLGQGGRGSNVDDLTGSSNQAHANGIAAANFGAGGGGGLSDTATSFTSIATTGGTSAPGCWIIDEYT